MAGMTEGRAILSIAGGCGAIAFALLRKQFYIGRILGGPTRAQGRPIPRWRGRIIFLAVGTVFRLFGLEFFWLGQ